MKAFTNLTEQELVALTEEDIRRYIDYACAENGVPLLPALPPEPPVVAFEPDAKVYSVGHYLHFTSVEDATRVMEAIKSSRLIDTDYLSTPAHITSLAIANRQPRIAIDVQDAFSQDKAAAIKRDLADAKIAQDIYDRAKKDYDGAVNDRQAYESDIRDAVAAAWDTHRKRESRRADYERYLSLADGNKQIAARFLDNAHRDARVLLPDLFIVEAECVSAQADEPASVGAVR